MTENETMIVNRLKVLIAEKELREGRKLTYRTIAQDTGIATSTLTAYATQKVNRFDAPTLEALCKYFDCQPGDILVWDKDDPWRTVDLVGENLDFDALSEKDKEQMEENQRILSDTNKESKNE
jgi:putative transcriptional regulator